MIRLDLPAPPSVNAMYRNVPMKVGGKPVSRTLLSQVGREYLAAVPLLARQQMRQQKATTIRGQDVEITVYWFRKIKRGDCTNRQKALEDALNTVAYADDGQIARSHIYRVDGPTKDRVLVIVAPSVALTEAEAREAFRSPYPAQARAA